MWDFAVDTYPVARKEYHCEASDHISMAGYGQRDYEPDDWATIVKAREEDNKILKGTEYLHISGKWEGDFAVYRARQDLHAICIKYDFYDE